MISPSSIIYAFAPKQFIGKGIMKASWETYIQHINTCAIVLKEEDHYVSKFHNFNTEIKNCLENLTLTTQYNTNSISTNVIRQKLQKH